MVWCFKKKGRHKSKKERFKQLPEEFMNEFLNLLQETSKSKKNKSSSRGRVRDEGTLLGTQVCGGWQGVMGALGTPEQHPFGCTVRQSTHRSLLHRQRTSG